MGFSLAIERFKLFLETNPVVFDFFKQLKTKGEPLKIEIVVDQRYNFCLIYDDIKHQIHFECHLASKPDFTFYLKPESVRLFGLNKSINKSTTLSSLLFKEFISGNLQIKLTGRLIDVYRKGYLRALRSLFSFNFTPIGKATKRLLNE